MVLVGLQLTSVGHTEIVLSTLNVPLQKQVPSLPVDSPSQSSDAVSDVHSVQSETGGIDSSDVHSVQSETGGIDSDD